MYSIYDTNAFILYSSIKREADKTFVLYTEDFGRVSATAQGVRLNQSKLRGHLLDYSLAHISIVRGKEVWRIVSAQRTYPLPRGSQLESEAFIRALKLLQRLVKGEEKHEELFTLLKNGYEYISSGKSMDAKVFEVLLISRILHRLGYIASTPLIEQYLFGSDFSDSSLGEFSPHIRDVIQLINKAIEESQL